MLFGNASCPNCAAAEKLFKDNSLDYKMHLFSSEPDKGHALRTALSADLGVPQWALNPIVFLCLRYIGGESCALLVRYLS